MSLLSGLLTLFVAVVGYRLVLGEFPSIRYWSDAMLRVGFILALVTSWPAAQTLIYRVAVDGPVELANIIVPAMITIDAIVSQSTSGTVSRPGTISAGRM